MSNSVHPQTQTGTVVEVGIVVAGFRDPFDVRKDVTLDNPTYRVAGVPLMAGKLDWLLLRRLAERRKDVGNHAYAASDHKWLSADVEFV